MAVEVPDSAKSPDAADLVLTATSQTDINQRSLLHLYAVVDTQNAYPDERANVEQLAGQIGGDAKSPGLELVALVAALGACVLLLRRRNA